MDDIHVIGTRNLGPDWSHYRVLKGCFITGLDRRHLKICCLALCLQINVLFFKVLDAEMTDVNAGSCSPYVYMI